MGKTHGVNKAINPPIIPKKNIPQRDFSPFFSPQSPIGLFKSTEEIIYLLSLMFILGVVVLYSQIGTELLEDNNPIQQEETIQLNEVEKVYEKYEMSNYR